MEITFFIVVKAINITITSLNFILMNLQNINFKLAIVAIIEGPNHCCIIGTYFH